MDIEPYMPYFKLSELTCRCGCGLHDMDYDFMQKIINIRFHYGHPMIVTSAFRCLAYNNTMSTNKLGGPHTQGRAMDFSVYGDRALKLLSVALYHGITGIGVGQKDPNFNNRFIHFDNLTPRLWSY